MTSSEEGGRPLALTEVVLLACEFWIKVPPEEDNDRDADQTPTAEEPPGVLAEEAEAEGSGASFVPVNVDLEGVELSYSADEQLDEFTLIIRVLLTDPTAPYTLELVMGSRFTKPEPAVSLEQVAATLLFMTYPYVRETATSITSRSPYRAFLMPPLTRLPHPRVTGEEEVLEDEEELEQE